MRYLGPQETCLTDSVRTGVATPRTAAGTKGIESLPGMAALPACPPRAHQDHSLEPPGQ